MVNSKNVWMGFVERLLFLRDDCECNVIGLLYLRQCFNLHPPSTETSISGTLRKLPICFKVSQCVQWRMTWRDESSCYYVIKGFCRGFGFGGGGEDCGRWSRWWRGGGCWRTRLIKGTRCFIGRCVVSCVQVEWLVRGGSECKFRGGGWWTCELR